MRPRHVALLVAFACGWIVWQVATLTRSPVPYYDDTFFASVGDSLERAGELKLPVSPLHISGPVYLYGPVYFAVQAFVFRHLGFGIFQNRILALLFGLGIVVVAFASLRQAGVRRDIALPACIALALDPTLHLSMHGGRMDTVALFFILASLVLLQKSWASESLALSATSGVLAAAGILTTPRPGYLVVLMGAILGMRFVLAPTRQRALQLVFWALPIAGLYALWVRHAFGDVTALLAYYGAHADTYVGGRLTVRTVHYPLLAVLAGVTTVRLLAAPKARFDELTWFSFAGIVVFYALGINAPRFGTQYCVFLTPLVYVALARLASDLDGRQAFGVPGASLFRIAFAALLVFNVATFTARSTLELVQWTSRDPAPADQVARRFIPPGSKVIGDDKFYFAVKNAGSDFQYWQRGGTLDERVAYQTDDYGFDYLVADPNESPDLFHAYTARAPLAHVATFEDSGAIGVVAEWLSDVARRVGVGTPLVDGYRGSIFVRADRVSEHR